MVHVECSCETSSSFLASRLVLLRNHAASCPRITAARKDWWRRFIKRFLVLLADQVLLERSLGSKKSPSAPLARSPPREDFPTSPSPCGLSPISECLREKILSGVGVAFLHKIPATSRAAVSDSGWTVRPDCAALRAATKLPAWWWATRVWATSPMAQVMLWSFRSQSASQFQPVVQCTSRHRATQVRQ